MLMTPSPGVLPVLSTVSHEGGGVGSIQLPELVPSHKDVEEVEVEVEVMEEMEEEEKMREVEEDPE